jgi:hypothetical protein
MRDLTEKDVGGVFHEYQKHIFASAASASAQVARVY